MEYSQCILKSIDKRKCAYPSKIDCIGCEYLIPEILFLMEFNNSLNILLKNLEDAYYSFDKQRYLYMFQNKYIPTLIEAISVFGIDRIDLFIDRKSFYKKIFVQKNMVYRYSDILYMRKLVRIGSNVKIPGDSHYKNKKYCSCFSKK